MTNLQERDSEEAMVRLLKCHGEKWLKFVRRIVGNWEDAEDVLQEAVRRVLVRNRLFGTDDEMRMYLGRAVANTAVEFYNSRKRERMRQSPLQEITVADPGSCCPHTALEEREKFREEARLIQILNDGLAMLPAKQYEALQLTLLQTDHSSMRDAGSAAGIPYSTLRHRSVQGLRRLRKFVHRALRSTTFKRASA